MFTVKTKLHDLKAIQTSIISLQTMQDNQTKSEFINAFVPLLQKQLQPADAFLKEISHEHQSICHTSNDIEVLVKELDLVIKQLAAHIF